MSTDRPLIAIVDYGAGNLRSVSRALAAAGAEPVIVENGRGLDPALAVVLPGVGAAGSAMRGLRERGLVEPIREVVASGRPFFGVCLGLQVLMTHSDEDGGVDCLNLIPGHVRRLDAKLKIPHMGWNQVEQRRPCPIFEDIPDFSNFYFVHSYVVVPDDPTTVVGTTDYGVHFASALARGNLIATQFHPEKSADLGLRIYRNFVHWAVSLATSPQSSLVERV